MRGWSAFPSLHRHSPHCGHFFWLGVWHLEPPGHVHGPGCGHRFVDGAWRRDPGVPLRSSAEIVVSWERGDGPAQIVANGRASAAAGAPPDSEPLPQRSSRAAVLQQPPPSLAHAEPASRAPVSSEPPYESSPVAATEPPSTGRVVIVSGRLAPPVVYVREPDPCEAAVIVGAPVRVRTRRRLLPPVQAPIRPMTGISGIRSRRDRTVWARVRIGSECGIGPRVRTRVVPGYRRAVPGRSYRFRPRGWRHHGRHGR
ncbi:MAG: hypothetical protein D6776_12115 [Planctomycetota bacterium]|nr:MAG: hypothetical protein D6776_12115 [Planctomycetota bacterium]